MGVVINCMGKGKEGSQTYNLYIEVYTQLERGKKQWSAQVRFTSLRSWTAEKSTSEITISLSLTYALMAKWQWKRIPAEGSCQWNSLLASSCQPGVWDSEGQEQERSLEGVYSCRQLLGQRCGSCLFEMIICSTWSWLFYWTCSETCKQCQCLQ